MNELNYASLEASKKLVDNGIVLKTDCIWAGIYGTTVSFENQKWVLIPKSTHNIQIPAPSMAEVLRKLSLKDDTEHGYTHLVFYSHGVSWVTNTDESFFPYKENNGNIIDALIDLLIWVKEQNRERIVKKLIDHADKLKW